MVPDGFPWKNLGVRCRAADQLNYCPLLQLVHRIVHFLFGFSVFCYSNIFSVPFPSLYVSLTIFSPLFLPRYHLNPYSYRVSWVSEKIFLRQNAKWLNCKVLKLIFCHLNIEYTCNSHHFKLFVSFLGSKTKICPPYLWFSVFFLMHYFTLKFHIVSYCNVILGS